MKRSGVVDLNDLFGSDEELSDNSDIKKINISKLFPFHNHPFKLYEGERLDDMVNSIKEFGILTPIIVRPLEKDKYEILSGHNRTNAAKLAGLQEVPAIVKEGLTDEEAMLIVTETNLIQRAFAELSHSEKARIITERHNAIKKQGKRTDLISEIETLTNPGQTNEKNTSRPMGKKIESDKELGKTYDLSPRNVSRYLRIDILIDELKERLDNNEIPFRAGVELSFLEADEQSMIESIIVELGCKVDLKKSELLKTFSKAKELNYNIAIEVLSGKYFDKPKKIKNFNLKLKLVNKYFNENQTESEIESIIDEALELYFSNSVEEDISQSRLEEIEGQLNLTSTD